MALGRANDLDIVEAHIAMPRTGAWVADLAVAAEDASKFEDRVSVTIKFADGLELAGAVAPGRASEFVGSVGVRVVAGAGGLGKPATAKGYANSKLGDIVNGLLRDAGETLDATADTALLAQIVPAWLVIKQSVGAALSVVLGKVVPDASWRVLPNGKIWIGSESWPDLSSDYDYAVLMRRPADRSAELGVATPLIAPGVNIPDLGRVSHVEHWVSPDAVRSVVTCETEQSKDRMKGALLALARAAVPGIDYLGKYTAKVVKQSGQKFDVQPDDDRLTGLTDVRLRNGIPGLSVQVTPGSYVLVGWENGDPRKPYVSLWDGGESVTEITIAATMVNVGGTGGKALVTKDDFDGHVHTGPSTVCANGAAWTGSTAPPTTPATGTTNMKGK
jgi:hypothetical protein